MDSYVGKYIFSGEIIIRPKSIKVIPSVLIWQCPFRLNDHYERIKCDDGEWYDLLLSKCITQSTRLWWYKKNVKELTRQLVRIELDRRHIDYKDKKLMFKNKFI